MNMDVLPAYSRTLAVALPTHLRPLVRGVPKHAAADGGEGHGAQPMLQRQAHGAPGEGRAEAQGAKDKVSVEEGKGGLQRTVHVWASPGWLLRRMPEYVWRCADVVRRQRAMELLGQGFEGGRGTCAGAAGNRWIGRPVGCVRAGNRCRQGSENGIG